MQPPSQVTLRAPATSANLGPGFDVFGLALDYPTDQVTLRAAPKRKTGVWIEVTGIQAETISTVPQRNTAGVVANHMMKEFGLKTALSIKIKKGICPSKGLGSSAASAAAVAYGINHLFNLKLADEQLIRYAAKGEVASAGTQHADNVSAAICGNFVILKSRTPLEIIKLKAPEDMEVCAAYPHMITPRHKTARARSVLPHMLSIRKLAHNVGNAASMACGFARGDVDLIGGSMTDVVVEPARATLIPGYLQVRENALKEGACGVTISGAGPAMLAVVNKQKCDAIKVAEVMREGYLSAGFEATAFVTKPGKGVCLQES
jgi:homoserine kinase